MHDKRLLFEAWQLGCSPLRAGTPEGRQVMAGDNDGDLAASHVADESPQSPVNTRASQISAAIGDKLSRVIREGMPHWGADVVYQLCYAFAQYEINARAERGVVHVQD